MNPQINENDNVDINNINANNNANNNNNNNNIGSKIILGIVSFVTIIISNKILKNLALNFSYLFVFQKENQKKDILD